MTRLFATTLIQVALYAALALLALVALPKYAKATEWDHGLFGGNAVYGPKQIEKERAINAYKPRPVIRHVERAPRSYMPSAPRESVVELKRPRDSEVRAWAYEKFPTANGPRISSCFAPIRTGGDQHLSIEGAKTEAIKAWSQQARHDLGERAMDFETARDGTFACVRSSIGSTLGQVFHRCEVIAKPCTAQHMQRDK